MVKKKKDKEDNKKINEDSFFNNDNLKLNIFTIKTSLKSIIKNFDYNYPIINQLVLDSNKYVIRTYQFMRLYFLYCYYNNLDFVTIDKDNVLYFMRALSIRDNRGIKAENNDLEDKLNDFYEKEFYPLIQKPKFNFTNKTYLIPYLAEEIATSFKNNIKEHFIIRFRRFLNIVQPKIKIYSNKKGKELDNEKKKIYNLVKNSILNDDIQNSCPEEYKKFATKIRNDYLPNIYENSFYYDCKKDCNLNYYLKSMIKMNLEIEQYNNRIYRKIKRIRGTKPKQIRKKKTLKTMIKKLFQIMPLRNNIIPGYITLDKAFIKNFFKEKGKSKYIKGEDEKEIWKRIINIDNKIFEIQEKKGYRLSTLCTDGICVSLKFKKIGLSKFNCNNDHIINKDIYLEDLNDNDLRILESKKIVSLDPGKKGLCLLDDKKNNLNYNTIQRRKESLRKRNNNIIYIEKLNNDIIEKETELSDYDSKTVIYNKFKDYITEKNRINNLITEFYQKELFRKLKFRSQVYLRKSEDNFLNNIKKTYGDSKDIVIAYGDWSMNKQMKHNIPSSNIGLRRKIEKKYKVFLIDEYCTSKLCSKCNKELKHYEMSKKDIENYEKKNKTILKNSDKKKHRLLVCSECGSSENKRSTFWNRDINACINMLNLTNEWIKNKSRNKLFNRIKN